MSQPDNASGKGEYLPTQAEIAAACEEIRRGWTPRELYRRSGRPERLTIPIAIDHGRNQNRRLYG